MVSNDEIRKKLAEKRNPRRKTLTENGSVSSDDLRQKFREKRNQEIESRKVESQKVEILGYLVCDNCGGCYELQPGESPDDFTDACECGGNLEHTKSLNND